MSDTKPESPTYPYATYLNVLFPALEKIALDPLVAQLEDELYELLNETGIGPMGLGGDVTVLQCHIEHADTHMTLNPVAVNYQCWAARRASAHIAPDGTVDYDREF